MIGLHLLHNNITEEHKPLNEAVQVDGADFLGTANGYDVFRLNTWQAAQGFTCDNNPQTVGACWTYNEDTFNKNITGDVKFFIVTRANTNQTVLAALSGIAGHETTELNLPKFNTKIVLRNFWIEAFDSNSENLVKAIPSQFTAIVPLYLFTDFAYMGEQGMSISDGAVIGSYAGLVESVPEIVTLPENVDLVKANAFAQYPAHTIAINHNVKMESHAFDNFDGHIETTQLSLEDAGWPEDWTNHPENVTWGVNLTPEERQRREAEIEERRRQAAEEQARAEAEAARIAAEREAQRQELLAREHQAMLDGLRFKEEKDHIVILGGKRSIREFDIPETINNKPVTKIAPFAFFENTGVTKIKLPRTIKEIGKAAFAGCIHLRLIYPENAVLYKDALDKVYIKDPFKE